MTFAIFAKGFLLGASLIIAIGPQNAFVLRQGLKRRHVFLCALTAALVDAVLISIGISGLALVLKAAPLLARLIRWAGALFLIAYGGRAFLNARKVQSLNSDADGMKISGWQTVGVLLGFSLLNPHVYLDTVLMLGGIGASYGDGRYLFAAGAVTASFAWFFGLGYGARLLAPLFARPGAWQILDIVIGCVMWAIAASLLLPS